MVLLCLFVLWWFLLHARNHGRALEPRVRTTRVLRYTGTTRLCEYLLVGTHGSAAYRITPGICVDDRGIRSKHPVGKIFPSMVRRWSLNQHYDIYSQLALGVRYLHLEVAVYRGDWVTLHSYLCGLDQVCLFLAENPGAFLLLHLQVFGTTQSVYEYVQTHAISGRVQCGVDREATLQSLRGKVVLFEPELYPADYVADLPLFLENRTPHRAPPPLSHTLRALQWVMTPSAATILWDVLLRPWSTGLARLPSVKDKALLRTHLATMQPSAFQILVVDHVDPETITMVEMRSVEKDKGHRYDITGTGP